MIPEEIFNIGNMLGLEHKDLQNLIPEKSSPDTRNNVEVSFSPLESYKVDGAYYGTISINHF